MSAGKNRLWIVLYGTCFLSIAVLSLDSHPPRLDLGMLNWDKLQHALAYATLTFLGVMAFRPLGRTRLFTASAALGISVLLGGVLEIGQGALTDTRFADVGDLLANTLGGALGMAAGLPFTSSADRTPSR